MKTGSKRRVTERFVFAVGENYSIEWRSEEHHKITQHSLTLCNPTLELIMTCRKAWNDTEGKFLRWKTAKEIVEEELSK